MGLTDRQLLRRAYEALNKSVPKADSYEELLTLVEAHQQAISELREALRNDPA